MEIETTETLAETEVLPLSEPFHSQTLVVAAETTKTLAETDDLSLSEPFHSQAVVVGNREESEPGSELGLGVGAHENGSMVFGVGDDAKVTDETEDKAQHAASNIEDSDPESEQGLGVGAHENGSRDCVGDAKVMDETEDKAQGVASNREDSDPGSELGLGVGAHENGSRVCVGDAKVMDETEDKAQHGASNREDSYPGSELGFGVGAHENGSRVCVEDAKVMDETEDKAQHAASNIEDSDPVSELRLGVGAHENGSKVCAGDAKVTDETEDKDQHAADQNGISIFVEVHGSLDGGNATGKFGGDEDNELSMAENEGNPCEKFREIPGFESKMGENGDVTGEGERKYEVNGNGNENEEDGEKCEDEDDGDGEEEYFVGDFVWGKIRGHPWWPGQIYDPSDASEYARKYNQRDRLLVAYFGDGSFSWCSPSQLKPFAKAFEEMSKQSDSKSFVNALQKALDELGRLVELKITRSCIPLEDRIGLPRPLARNAGIKQGVLVPECDISRLSIPQLGPVELFETLRYIAEVGSTTSLLELTVLRSCLSALYLSKGRRNLAMYQEPQSIEEQEDKNSIWVTDITDFSGPDEVPVQGPSKEDWASSPVQGGCDQMNQTMLQKCRGILEDKFHHRRKRKSLAKLMKEQNVIEATGRKKRKSSEEAENHQLEFGTASRNQGSGDFTSPSGRRSRRRKVVELLGSPKSIDSEVLSAEDGVGVGQEEGMKHDKVSNTKNDDSDVKEGAENVFLSRERKRSKYLSPPFTSLKSMVRNSSSKITRDSEAESPKTAKFATGEADQLTGSQPIEKFCDEILHEELSKQFDNAVDTSDNPSPRQLKRNQKKIIDSMEINASTKEVVSEVKSAALNPVFLREKNAVDMMEGFISAFRSAMYVEGLNYKKYQKLQPVRKRKRLNTGDFNVDDEASRLLFIKQKLEMMTQMLENSDGNMLAEMKSNLESEMKGLLEKVSSMAESILS